MRTAVPEQPAQLDRSLGAQADRSWPSNKACAAIAIGAVLVFLALAIGTALTSRPITDEGLFADPAYTLATKGYMGSPALRENTHLLGIERRTYWIFPLDPILQAAWYRLFGPGLFSMRSLSICAGLLGLGAVFILVEKLSRDRRVALIALALTATDYLYIYGSASGRMDIICAALGYCGLGAYMALRERNFTLAVLLGNALIVASGVTHPNGFLYFIGLTCLTIYFDRRRLRLPHVLMAAVPYLIGATLWGLYISQDYPAFLAQIKANAHDGGRLEGLRNPLMGFVREITVRYATAYGLGAHSAGSEGPIYLKTLALLAYLAGLAGVLFIPELRRRTETRVMVWLIAIYFFYFAIFDGQKAYYYLIHFVPMYASLLAIFLFWLTANRKINRAAISVTISVIIAVQLAGLAYRMRLNSYKNIYGPAVQYLQHNANDSQLIDANIAFLFGLNFPHNLIDDSHLNKLVDFFVIDAEIAERLKNSRTGSPATYQHVVNLLSTCYEKAYDRNSIKIYKLRGSACRANGTGS